MGRGSEYLVKDERLMKPSKICEKCNEDLQIEISKILYYHKSSQKWLCYNCYKKIVIDEDIIYFSYRSDGLAEMIRTRTLGAGGFLPNRKQKSSPLELSLILDNNKKCDHSIKYLNKFNLLFECLYCNEWICAMCLEEHKGHSIIGYERIGSSDEVVQVIPYIYDSLINPEEVILKINSVKMIDEKLIILLEIQNVGEETIYDIEIDFGIKFDFLKQNPEYYIYEIGKIGEINLIEPKTMKKIDLEINLNNLNIELLKKIPFLISITYKDFFDSSTFQEVNLNSYLNIL